MERQKILIIDDDKDALDALKRRLEHEGYDISTACDGEEGLAKAETFKPHLVITDIKMPKKDGLEVLRALWRQPHNKRLPIIMLSGIDDFDKVKEAYRGEADFYITKPIDLIPLLRSIRTLLNLAKFKKR